MLPALFITLSGAACAASGPLAPDGVGEFARVVTFAGDVDEDGFGDVLIGGTVAPGSWVGLYRGSAQGLAAAPSWVGDGTSFASAGDVDGDGFGDIIVGDPTTVYDGAVVGSASVYFGGLNGIDEVRPPWVVYGESANERLGAAVGAGGDVDGDGYADVLVGSPGHDGDRGRVRLFRGAPDRPIAGAAWLIVGDQPGAQLGSAVGTAWDVDADGFSDVLVGAAGGDGLAAMAYLYRGAAPRPDSAPAWSIAASTVRGIGDCDGDGFADVAALADAPDPAEARVSFYFGGRGAVLAGRVPISGDAAATIGPVGDANGDGYADVLVGGALVFGTPTGPGAPRRLVTDAPAQSSVATGIGDVDGDGFADVLVSRLSGGSETEVVGGVWSGLSEQPEWVFDDFENAAAAGDINGDGYDDLVVGDWDFVSDDLMLGRVLLLRGSSRGPEPTPMSTLYGSSHHEAFGFRAEGVGDVDGDGIGDVLVTAPRMVSGSQSQGRADVYWGSVGGLLSRAERAPASVWPSENQVGFGVGGHGVGDVDGDGFADIVIGIESDGGGSAGVLELYRGEAGGLASQWAWRLKPPRNDGTSRARVHDALALGDIDGDGLADFGSDSEDRPGDIFFGSRGDIVRGEISHWGDEEPHEVRAAGDIDGDGRGDVLIGARTASDRRGQVDIVRMGGDGLATFASLVGSQGGAQLGDAIGSAGDLDGDGYADIAVAALYFDVSDASDAGRAWVHFGGPSGLRADDARAWHFDGDRSNAGVGFAVGTVGDLDGDGFPELSVVSVADSATTPGEGRVRIFRGNGAFGFGAAFAYRARARRPGSGLVIPAWGASDAAQGFDLSAAGRSPLGPARVGLEAEVLPWDVPFKGVITARGELFASDIDAAALVLRIRGLAEASAFHWRARVRHDPAQAPIQASSRWLYGGLPGQPASVHLRTSRNHGPNARGEAYSFNEDAHGMGSHAPGLLANDSDSDGDTLTVTKVSEPAHGDLVMEPDGAWFYAVDDGYRGRDGFDYQVSDGHGASAVAHVALSIEPGGACLGATLASCAAGELRTIIDTAAGPRSLRCHVVDNGKRELVCALDGAGEAVLGSARCEAR